MTIKELAEKYNMLSSDVTKQNLVKSVISRTYAPILEKKICIDEQFKKAIVEKDGIQYIDRFLANINMMFVILCLYTNLDIADKAEDGYSTLDEYDALTETRIFDLILVEIGEREITELMNVNTQVEESFFNLQTTEAYIAKQITRFAEILGVMADSGAKQLANVLEDEKKINSIMDKFKEFAGKAKFNIMK